MKPTKLLILAFLCLALSFSFISCDTDEKESNSDTENTANDNVLPGGGGQSGENNGDNNNGNTEDSDNTLPEKGKRELNVRLDYAGDFCDGYAFVAFTEDGIDYRAIINTEGIIIYKTYASYTKLTDGWYHMGDGHFIVKRHKSIDNFEQVYEIVNSKGEVTASSLDGEFDTIVGTGNGYALVHTTKHTVTEKKYMYALIDKNGDFVTEYASLSSNNFNGEFKYIGDGIFACWSVEYSTNLFIYSSNDSACTLIKGVSGYFDYKSVNGVIYLPYGAHIYNNNTQTNDKLPYGWIALKGDGTYEQATTYTSFSNGKFIDQTDEYLKIIDPITNTTITYTEYTNNYVYRVECHGEYSIIFLSNAGISFFTVIDSTGKQMFEPIECSSVSASDDYAKNFIYTDGKLIYHVSGSTTSSDPRICAIIDVTDGSEIFSADLRYDIRGYKDGIITAHVANYINYKNYSYFIYLNESGEQILKTLYEYYE